MVSPADFLRLAVDRIRLGILGAAAAAPIDVAALAESLGVDERQILREVGRLRNAGLIDDGGALDIHELQEIAQALPQVPKADEIVTEGSWTADELDILGRFFSGSRLTSIPANQSKRRIVLERLVQEFEPGLRYEEREVNFTLQMFYADYAALRRGLVDEGLMTRADGVYWRTGGRYATP